MFIDWNLDGTYNGGDGISGVVMNLVGYNDLGEPINGGDSMSRKAGPA